MTNSVSVSDLVLFTWDNGVVAVNQSSVYDFCRINSIFLCNEKKNGFNCFRFDMCDNFSNEYVGQIDVIGD
jgi:hypothetical protein